MKTIKKIYVVTDGAYSDYHICGAFSSRYRAKKATSKLGGRIEVLSLDATNKIIGMAIFVVTMTREGDTLECEKRNMDWYNVKRYLSRDFHADSRGLHSWVLARDEKHAVKIANERRVQAIAEGKL